MATGQRLGDKGPHGRARSLYSAVMVSDHVSNSQQSCVTRLCGLKSTLFGLLDLPSGKGSAALGWGQPDILWQLQGLREPASPTIQHSTTNLSGASLATTDIPTVCLHPSY